MTLALSAGSQSRPAQLKTVVEPLPGDNLAGPCSFQFTLPEPQKPVRAIWITYDRGYDIESYYRDPEVLAFSRKSQIALILAHQCPAREPPTGERGEMDMDPSHGIARSIFTAIDDFARQSHHPELPSTKLILLGFSGTGALFAHFVKYAPDRVAAAVLTNPGQSDPYGMDRIDLPSPALNIPQFIIAGGMDDRGGTERPYEYFRRHRDRGAPWVFLVQNGIPHCCVINAKPLLLEWLDGVIGPRKLDPRQGWNGFIRPCAPVRRDHWGEPLWNVCDASVQPSSRSAPTGQIPAAWFPSSRLALNWLAFIRQKEHPATSFPDGLDAQHSRFAIGSLK